MLAYKFLSRDGSTVISGVRWPAPDGDEPGPWLEAAAVRPCREGIHGCRPDDLAFWLHQELWEIELDDEVTEADHKVVARRGRLLRRRPEWSGGVAVELATWCAWRGRDHAVSVLRATGQVAWAERVSAASTLDELGALAPTAAAELGETSVAGKAVMLATDAAAASRSDHHAGAPFVAACAAGHAMAMDHGTQADYDEAYLHERELQSIWLATRLGIS